MDAALNRKSLALGIPGIILQLVGNFLPNMVGSRAAEPSAGVALASLAVMILGTVMLIAGLSWYARAKGHSGWWGLMGLLSIIGLIVLAFLPDRLKGR